MNKALTRAAFALEISTELVRFVTILYRRFNGNPDLAKAELKKIPDYWTRYDENRQARDQELQDLKAQGK